MDTVNIMREYLNQRNTATSANDNGLLGKAYEVAVRSFIMNRRVLRVKTAGKVDIRATLDGKRATVEIKTACGKITTAASAQVIIYAPIVDIDEPAEAQGFVFTREEWEAFVDGYTGRGSFTRVDKAGEVHIQSFYGSETVRPKASKPIRAYIDEVCANQPTVEEVWERA